MSKVMRWSMLIIVASALALLNGGLNHRAVGQSDRSTALDGASITYRLDWVAVGEVSGGDSASTGYRLSATIGQMGAGTRSVSAKYALCVGFQCGGEAGAYRVYLPLVVKS